MRLTRHVNSEYTHNRRSITSVTGLAGMNTLFGRTLTTIKLQKDRSHGDRTVHERVLVIVHLIRGRVIRTSLLRQGPFNLQEEVRLQRLVVSFLGFFLRLFGQRNSAIFLHVYFNLRRFRPATFRVSLLSLLQGIRRVRTQAQCSRNIPIAIYHTTRRLPYHVHKVQLEFARVRRPQP